MSQENVEVVRGMVDAWNRDDFEGWLGGAVAHPDVEWSSAILRQVEGGDAVARGRDEVRRYWDEWHELWDVSLDASEIREVDDVVVMIAAIATKGRSSAALVERQMGFVFEFEERLVRRVTAYMTPAEALEAVGLSE